VFRGGDFSAESFALITCFQTIEHLPDPMTICRDIYRLLKPGGAALLVGHNRRAVSARILGERSPIFDIEHLQLFSPRSLYRLMTVAGFTDVHTGSLLNRYPLSYWARLLPMPRSLKNGVTSALNASGIGRLALPLPAGNMYVVAFKASRDRR
jgi:SAM-dependent methyltransferase